MNCRICGAKCEKVFNLGYQPISNDYYEPDSPNETHYPLEMFFCNICKFIQIDEVVKATDIFVDNYAYMSSCSDSWLKHCSEYVDYMIERFKLKPEESIMEIASNDGYLLKFFVEKGFRVRGVEPAGGVARIAIEKGVDTDMEFFNVNYSLRERENIRPRVIIANNVIAHNPNVDEFVQGICIMMQNDTIFTIEFPHLYNLITQKQFDTIYHEHYSYFTLMAIMELVERHDMVVFDVQELPTHGGSLRIFVKHYQNATNIINIDNIQKVIDKEISANLYDEDTYRKFFMDIQEIKFSIVNFLIEQKRLGKRVVAYGAPAKGNTFLNYCGIREDLIEYTVDRSEFKVGKVLPGSRIPIYDVSKLLNDNPDYIFILPWNIKKEIIGLFKGYSGKFITAIPNLSIT
jgi:hypothetical protein